MLQDIITDTLLSIHIRLTTSSMEHMGRKIAADRKSDPNPTVEELVPPFSWADDSSDHYLIVDLPGFKKEELSVQVDAHGDVQVKGRRMANENRIIKLDQTFRMPPNSNTENISARFESGILYVILPKEVKEEEDPRDKVTANDEKRPDEPKADETTQDLTEKRENNEKATATREEGFQPPPGTRWRREDGLQASVAEMLSGGKRIVGELLIRKKEIVITAVLAFSLGVFVAQRFQSNVGIGCD